MRFEKAPSLITLMLLFDRFKCTRLVKFLNDSSETISTSLDKKIFSVFTLIGRRIDVFSSFQSVNVQFAWIPFSSVIFLHSQFPVQLFTSASLEKNAWKITDTRSNKDEWAICKKEERLVWDATNFFYCFLRRFLRCYLFRNDKQTLEKTVSY